MLPDGGGLDPGCPPALRGVDSDCDGIYRLRRANHRHQLDAHRLGQRRGAGQHRVAARDRSPRHQDLDEDPDNDGLANRNEVRLHTNPAPRRHRDAGGERLPLRPGGGRPGRRAGSAVLPLPGGEHHARARRSTTGPTAGCGCRTAVSSSAPTAATSSLTGASATVPASTRSRSRSPCSPRTTRPGGPSSAPSAPAPRATRWAASSRRWTASSASTRATSFPPATSRPRWTAGYRRRPVSAPVLACEEDR